MRKSLISLFVGGLGVFAWADVKPFMDEMLQEMFKLKPYIASEESFKDPKNSEKIEASLKKMADLSAKIPHDKKIERSGFQIPSQILNQQLKETEVVFRHGNKDYSLWLLKSTLGVCMSCHTQVPAVSTQFSKLNREYILPNPFEEAEFQFVIRDFKEAMKLYAQAMAGFPKNKVSSDDLEKILYRQQYYYVRVQRDFEALSGVMSVNLSNKQLPKHLIKKIKSTKVAVDEMKKEKFPEFTDTQDQDLKNYVETSLKEELAGKFSFESPKKELGYLKVSGVLYEYLNKYPGTRLKPDILYWLSFCESHNNPKAIYSFPELYLKQCVLEFPKNPTAKKCLREYQDLVTRSYSGTRGTEIPAEVSRELKTMQELVKEVGN